VCPYCPEQETYQRLPVGHFARSVVEGAMQMCRDEFEVESDGLGTAMWMGNRPETVFEAHLNRCNIYIGRNSDPWQIMYSGSHEAFHRVCSPCTGRHWADEMFAVLFSLLYLARIGQEAHAERNRQGLLTEAERCSIETMFALDGPCPDGLYGRVYVLGQALIDVIGWNHLKTLATTKGADGRMDVQVWLASLPDEDQDKVRPLLQSALAVA
jgi:hypothetical protein